MRAAAPTIAFDVTLGQHTLSSVTMAHNHGIFSIEFHYGIYPKTSSSPSPPLLPPGSAALRSPILPRKDRCEVLASRVHVSRYFGAMLACPGIMLTNAEAHTSF